MTMRRRGTSRVGRGGTYRRWPGWSVHDAAGPQRRHPLSERGKNYPVSTVLQTLRRHLITIPIAWIAVAINSKLWSHRWPSLPETILVVGAVLTLSLLLGVVRAWVKRRQERSVAFKS